MKEFIHLFTPVTEGLPEKEIYVLYLDVNGKATIDIVIGSYTRFKHTYTHWLDLSKLTTKDKAIQIANKIGNDILIDRSTTRKMNCSNDISQYINENKGELCGNIKK